MKTMLAEIQTWDKECVIRVPLSMAPPLRWVNSYMLRGPEGITIIDPGPRTAETEREWSLALRQLDIAPGDVAQIMVTHHHPDHYGLAGYLQSITGAAVRMSRRAYEETQLMWGKDSVMNEELPRLFRRHGMPPVWSGQLPPHLRSFFSQVTPAPEVDFIREGEAVVMGGRCWLPLESAGHAPGHLSFYDPERKLMFCGDAVLPQISPNISFLPGSDPQPLQSFLTSLERFASYEVRIAFRGIAIRSSISLNASTCCWSITRSGWRGSKGCCGRGRRPGSRFAPRCSAPTLASTKCALPWPKRWPIWSNWYAAGVPGSG